MACKTSFEFHHNFPKLAEESGFTFNIHKPRVHLEWNKIRLIDIESLIRDRKFILIEQHLNDILDCVLESQFDVRILDEGVLKIFRLAQLAVEYQQFCRHYLDRSVYVLREEITALAQELDYAKKTIREKEDEIRKLKRKTKYNFRGSLPYGNDNIANIILQTLSRKNDIFANTPQLDNVHYNKCTYCDKVFLNQLYLKGHMLRRHNNVTEIPQKDVEPNQAHTADNDHSILQNEVFELKSKLKEMEDFMKNVNAQNNTKLNSEVDKNVLMNPVEHNKADITQNKTDESPVKQMKDAEISTNIEEHILDKMEEWKKAECERYNKEISMLRTQISNLIDSYKDADRLKTIPTDNKIIEQLNDTIKKQSTEIVGLKETINNLGLKSKSEDVDTKKEIEAQIAFWAERVEVQSREYKLLLQKLDIVAKEAHESRKCAELERQRATKLQLLLEQNINNGAERNNQMLNGKTNFTLVKENSVESNTSPKKSNPVPDHKTLEKLHRRAQELLNTESMTSSDVSSTDGNNTNILIEKQKTYNEKNTKGLKNNMSNRNGKKSDNISNHKTLQKNILKANPNTVRQVLKKHKSASKISNNSLNNNCSPKKVVRAKLTEEVNQRLASLRVDPLKKTLPQSIFQKHRLELQKNQEIKTKKNPARENVYHSIIAYLDNKVQTINKKSLQEDAYVSPNRNTKSFSLSSMISNVKSKALSLVKTSEEFNNEDRSSYETVTKKSLILLNSPPGSKASSPKTETQNYNYETRDPKELISTNHKKNKQKSNKIRNGYVKKMKKVSETSKDSDTDTTENFRLYNKETLAAKSIEDFIKSPNRLHNPSKKSDTDELMNDQLMSVQTKHLTNTFKEVDTNTKLNFNTELENDERSSDDIASLMEHELRNVASDENINSHKQTKGVLKNASSMSSLYKKKVIFDMDAIQMKSVSASPSQSVTEKNDKDEKYELGIINLDTEEWDLSSIENEPRRVESTVIKRSSTSPKIAELKQSIESQLTRRNPTLSTTLVGGVDVLKGPLRTKAASLGGSNTSLGSSILDDSESDLQQNHTAFVKQKNVTEKDDSEIDISQFVIDSIDNKNKRKSF
ncbi:unnamed protein product [Parnassius mnemosyne]|uniref:C2H2-type domain-containing protein n=1 Tax=Parnassius mnemosyne TaxID=213953 RepID=A0AAV1LXR6_9NEOP